MVNSLYAKEHGFGELVKIMEKLRAPGGCPWDAEQTHATIRANMLEEAYEAAEAIDKCDDAHLCEELGDVMLQVVFHATMAAERGAFTIEDVLAGICEKLTVRHPHVFGQVTVSDSGEVLRNWDAIKRETKSQKTRAESMESVSRALPALMRAEKIGTRAHRAGFDWETPLDAFPKLEEEVAELKAALETNEGVAEELGDVLFAAAHVGRLAKTDPEEALTRACDKFVGRFAAIEALAAERGWDWDRLSLDEKEALWQEIKRRPLDS